MFACNAQFSMHRGRQCAAPNELATDAGPGGAPKGASPGLAGGATAIFFLCRIPVAKRLKSVNVCLQMPNFQCIGAGSMPAPNQLARH